MNAMDPNQNPFCGIVHNTDDGNISHLPLEEVRIQIKIIDVSAAVTFTQIFANTATEWSRRAKYVFPVPARAAVSAFEMRTEDGRVITGIAKEKEQATNDHEKAIKEGRRTGLVEWATDDIFTISLGPLPPRQDVTTQVTFVMDLMTDDLIDQVRFQLPMVIGQRYGTLPSGMKGVTHVGPKTRVRIDIFVQTRGTIKTITSPTHSTISVKPYKNHRNEISRHRATVKLRSSNYLNCDFVLSIQANGLDAPRCFVEHHPSGDGSLAMQLTMVPKFDLPPVQSQEYIFLVDRSGSMSMDSPTRISVAKHALAMLLRCLPQRGTTFNIFSFGNHCDSLWPMSQPYNADTLRSATLHVSSMDADYGGTEIRSALECVFASRNSAQSTAIFVLSDGESYDLDRTLLSVSSALLNASAQAPLRVFTLGIGSDASSAMCEGIARAGNGVCLMATNVESMIAKCAKLVRAGRTFILKDVEIDWGIPVDSTPGVASPSIRFVGQDAVVQHAPHSIDAIYPGNRFIVFALITPGRVPLVAPKEIILRARRDGGQEVINLSIPVNSAKYSNTIPGIPLIHVLAAHHLITEIQMDQSPSGTVMTQEQRKAEVTRLGVKYQLASRFTSFVAIDGIEGLPALGESNNKNRAPAGSQTAMASAPQPSSQGDTPELQPESYVQIGWRYALGYANVVWNTFFRPWRQTPDGHYEPIDDSPLFTSPTSASRADDSDPPQDDYETDATFTTLSSLISYSSSDWSDDRIRMPRAPPDNELTRSPSPDFIGAYKEHDPMISHGQTNFAARSGAPTTIPAPPPVDEKVFELVQLQSFDGSFSLSTEFEGIVGDTAVAMNQQLRVDEKVWATALAIAYLRKHLSNQPELLDSFVDKIMEFVSDSSSIDRRKFETLVARARDAVA
ncbi:VIT-domain-containing protein [Panus rudis PR-1116 ss-1]|nr:VIT-domain-containing protein [Panus rudis PR-1116 ss-1]